MTETEDCEDVSFPEERVVEDSGNALLGCLTSLLFFVFLPRCRPAWGESALRLPRPRRRGLHRIDVVTAGKNAASTMALFKLYTIYN